MRANVLKTTAVAAAVFASGVFAQIDTAKVPFRVNVNATITAGIGQHPGSDATIPFTVTLTVTGKTTGADTLKLPVAGTLSVWHNGAAHGQLNAPVITTSRGNISLHLPTQQYQNAEFSLHSVNGKRVLRGKANVSVEVNGVSRKNVAPGVYMLSVKGVDGNAYTTRLTHNGGNMNINVAFGATASSARHAELAKSAADGDWSITVSATEPNKYKDSVYTYNVTTAGIKDRHNVTLIDTSSTTPNQCADGAITTRSWTNVDYAPTASRRHSRQRYDIKLPTSGNEPFPLLIYVHSGGFSGGDWQLAQNNNGLVSRANSNGYAVASVGYLLMGQSGWSGGQRAFPENVEDVLAAVRHLRANACTYHIDPDKFAVSGFSAGAYMTAIVCALSNATNHDYDITSLGNAGVSHAVQGAASSAALTDFSLLETHESANGGSMLDHNATPEGAMLGGNLTNNTETMRKYLTMQNPLTHITAATPPIYMLHGTSDNLVPWQQSEIMVNKVNSFVPNKAVFNKVSSRSHADFEGSSAASTIAILNFLDNALGIQR